MAERGMTEGDLRELIAKLESSGAKALSALYSVSNIPIKTTGRITPPKMAIHV